MIQKLVKRIIPFFYVYADLETFSHNRILILKINLTSVHVVLYFNRNNLICEKDCLLSVELYFYAFMEVQITVQKSILFLVLHNVNLEIYFIFCSLDKMCFSFKIRWYQELRLIPSSMFIAYFYRWFLLEDKHIIHLFFVLMC